ncbi:MAG: type II toxin-antitoxin system HipA family toxin [Pseudomonadales bacterium]|nr:type II toxin-antitoxin system HipA family toxin [Pseudomonadales bacterium]
MSLIEVFLWGTKVGQINYPKNQPLSEPISTFSYSDQAQEFGIDISPLTLNTKKKSHSFEDISYRTFKGLAGVFSDSLPDKFGSQLIDIYMAEKNIPANEVTSLDRLKYIANRGMGALEYRPSELTHSDNDLQTLDLAMLNELASMSNTNKEALAQKLHDAESRSQALKFIRVSSSAGGARSKALIATKGDQIKDGTVDHGTDHDYWLLKFDAYENSDRDGKDPKGMTRVEYIYSIIARACNINMPKTKLLTDGDDAHFLIERFDRIKRNGKLDKLHYVSWCGLAHAHRDTTGTYSYEQLVLICKQLGLDSASLKELFRRAVFNIVGLNQDDHTKNFGFLMDRELNWQLSPAFDLTYAYDPTGRWTNKHQILLNRKQADFERNDLIQFGLKCNLTKRQANEIIDLTIKHFKTFDDLAKEHQVPEDLIDTIKSQLRLYF